MKTKTLPIVDQTYNDLLVAWLEAYCSMHAVNPIDLDYELI